MPERAWLTVVQGAGSGPGAGNTSALEVSDRVARTAKNDRPPNDSRVDEAFCIGSIADHGDR